MTFEVAIGVLWSILYRGMIFLVGGSCVWLGYKLFAPSRKARKGAKKIKIGFGKYKFEFDDPEAGAVLAAFGMVVIVVGIITAPWMKITDEPTASAAPVQDTTAPASPSVAPAVPSPMAASALVAPLAKSSATNSSPEPSAVRPSGPATPAPSLLPIVRPLPPATPAPSPPPDARKPDDRRRTIELHPIR